MSEIDNGSPTAAPHPEEMKGTVHLRIGDNVSLEATWRTTPAGLVCAGVADSEAVMDMEVIPRAARATGALSGQATAARQEPRVE